MTTLRSKLIRLAHQKPELRPHLLPLLTKQAQGKMRSPTKEEVLELRNFVRGVIKAPVKTYQSSKGTSVDIQKPIIDTPGEGEKYVKVAEFLIKNGWVTWPEGTSVTLREMQASARKYDAFYAISNLMKSAD